MDALKVLESKLLIQINHLKLFEEKVLHPNGKVHTHATLEHPGAVVVMPRMDNGNFLLVEQYRHSIRRELLEFPAGTLEKDELPLECAKREITEEVGHKADRWSSLGVLYPAPGFCNEQQHLFFADQLSEARGELDEDEIINVKQMSVSEIETAIGEGRIADAKSIAIFLKARIKGLI